MPHLVAYALRREDADRLADALNRVLISERESPRSRGVVRAGRPLKAYRAIAPLPVVLRVSRWPKEFEIVWQSPSLPLKTLSDSGSQSMSATLTSKLVRRQTG